RRHGGDPGSHGMAPRDCWCDGWHARPPLDMATGWSRRTTGQSQFLMRGYTHERRKEEACTYEQRNGSAEPVAALLRDLAALRARPPDPGDRRGGGAIPLRRLANGQARP